MKVQLFTKRLLTKVSNVFKDTPGQLFEYGYGLRNELYTKRLQDGELRFWVIWAYRIFIKPFRIAMNRKDNKWTFTKVVWRTSLNTLDFQPKIEPVEKLKKVGKRSLF